MKTSITFARRTKKYIAEFNLFKDEFSRSDTFHLRTAIISTRIYFILVAISVITLIVYNSLGSQTEVIIIPHPSQSEYETFFNKYGTALSCPCSNVTIPYGNFTLTTVDYHPVFKSIFVSNKWINNLFNPEFVGIYQGDFRALASNYFQLLATFCSHVNRSVSDAIDKFESESFLTPYVLLNKSLHSQIAARRNFLKLSVTSNIFQLLHLVQSTTRSNRLQTSVPTSTRACGKISGIFTNYEMKLIRFSYSLQVRCLCTTDSGCFMPSGFFDIGRRTSDRIDPLSQSSLLGNIPGFFVGCFPVESLLKSTLECLFDWSCLETIHKFIPSSNITGVYALDTNQTQFLPNTSIEILLNELFIESWSMEPSFSKYYSQCAPIQCIHTLSKQNNGLYVLTKLLGLYGGLTAALRFFVPLIVGSWRKRRITTTEASPQNHSLVEHLQMIWERMRVKMTEFTLFKTPTMRTDPFERTTLKISTWIYIILLCLSMIIIALFTWLSVRIDIKTIKNPTLSNFEDLENEYPKSFECPCSEIAISHESFISIYPEYHPVCNSTFISDEWIESLRRSSGTSSWFTGPDIFRHWPNILISLQILCKLMEKIVSDASLTFNQSSLITNKALSYVEFKARANEILEQFKQNTKSQSKRSLALIRSQTAIMYTTGTYDIYWHPSSRDNSLYPRDMQAVSAQIDNCLCALRDDCKEQLGFYIFYENKNHLMLNISNMYASCFPIQSLMQSSLECFFDQACLGHMTHYIRHRDAQPIWDRNLTGFYPETFLDEIINEMMIETWGDNISHNNYYKQCAPEICTYFITSRNNALYIFTTMIGLFGGLSIALRIIVPFIITQIRKRIYRRAETDSPRFVDRVRALWQLIKTKAIELNLFQSEASWDDPVRRQYEIITTRIYLLFLIISVIILVVYTSITVQLLSFTKKNFSQSDFENLASDPRYSSTLDCPCQNISIPYNLFISISPHYHPFCSSDFVVHNSSWINLIYHGLDLLNYPYDDYRHFIVPHFRLLFDLCTLANNTLNDALSIFKSNTLISNRAQSPQVVLVQMEATVNQFRSSVPQTFMRMLDFIRQLAQGNGLVSSIGSNWYPIVMQNIDCMLITPRSYGKSNCSCATSSTCTSSTTIGNWSVPGFLVGCYPLESLLQSTLQCLYNITCIDKLKKPNQFSNISIHPLNPTLSSPNMTVQSLIEKLMVYKWETNISYNNYYAACAPISCTYFIRERANTIYLITTIIGFIGGLSVALKVITPIIAKIGHYLIIRRQRRVEPSVAVIS